MTIGLVRNRVRVPKSEHTKLGDGHFVQKRVYKRVFFCPLLVPRAFWVGNARVEAVSTTECQLRDATPEGGQEPKSWLEEHGSDTADDGSSQEEARRSSMTVYWDP
jgi:hypothetical protein